MQAFDVERERAYGMRKRALIGDTGFVGGNLSQQWQFDAGYNSRNIESLSGASFETIVCAGAPAAKWLANRDPATDRAQLERLVNAFEGVRCQRFVLISTIDVYPIAYGADESFDCSGENHAYGTHRLWLEQRVRERFPGALIARLPALFGAGLKKNVLYDLIHDNRVEVINPRSTFQWYGLAHLGRDLEHALLQGLELVNLFPEPVATSAICALFPDRSPGTDPGPEQHYDLGTRHSKAVRGASCGRYLQSAESVLSELADFVARERRTRAA